jgi:serine/threonine protein kinase
VFRARHKQSGVLVAFKRVKPSTARAKARMGREIQAAQAFGENPHVMPVLDHSGRNDWFVMPLAGDTAETVRLELTEVAELRELVTAICAALRPAHATGWIHRDLKPSNLLKLNGTWTVADWGITRRPLGQTTDPDRTRVGVPFGTDGWAAPELSTNAHAAGPQADIYGIGQIIGWAVTGQRPQANTPLIPPRGPWRQVVKAATRPVPARRPATVDALLKLIIRELDYGQPGGTDTAGLVRAANEGDQTSAAQLFATAARYPSDKRLYMDVLPGMTRHAVAAAVDADPDQAAEVVRAAAGHVLDPDLRPQDAIRIITWLHWIQVRAGERDELGLLEETISTVFTWDRNRGQIRKLIMQWLAGLRGDQAAAAASALREHDTSGHFAELADDRHVDARIRHAARRPNPAVPKT